MRVDFFVAMMYNVIKIRKETTKEEEQKSFSKSFQKSVDLFKYMMYNEVKIRKEMNKIEKD